MGHAWSERKHTITATADAAPAGGGATLTVTVRGNKVQIGSFDQADADGAVQTHGRDTGTSSWSEGGSHGERSATITGSGGNAVLAGGNLDERSDAVTAGEVLILRAAVDVDGASSAPSVWGWRI